jgi:hypothetical protein
MGLRDALRRLRREVRGETFAIHLEDGSVRRFHDDEFVECLVHEFERDRRAWDGEEPGPAHPIIETLRHVSEDELQRVIKHHGTMLGHQVGEDEKIRTGEPGPIPDLCEP